MRRREGRGAQKKRGILRKQAKKTPEKYTPACARNQGGMLCFRYFFRVSCENRFTAISIIIPVFFLFSGILFAFCPFGDIVSVS